MRTKLIKPFIWICSWIFDHLRDACDLRVFNINPWTSCCLANCRWKRLGKCLAWAPLQCRCTSIDILGKLNDYSRASAGDHIVKWAIFSDDWWHSVCVRNGFITWSTPFAFINYVWRQSWQEEEKMPMELLNAPCCMPQCVYASFICLAFCVPCCIVIVTLLIWSPF